MSDHHHLHLHRHHEEKHDKQDEVPYDGAPAEQEPSAPAAGNYPPEAGLAPSESVVTTTEHVVKLEAADQAYASEHKHKRNEHLGELGALAAGAFAAYEEHKVKVDPAHAGRHRIEESVAGAVLLGSGGLAVYEHHQIKTGNKAEAAEKHDEKHDKHHKKHDK